MNYVASFCVKLKAIKHGKSVRKAKLWFCLRLFRDNGYYLFFAFIRHTTAAAAANTAAMAAAKVAVGIWDAL